MRLLRLLIVIAFLLMALSSYATDVLRPTGYEAVTVDTTVGGVRLTEAKYYNTTTNKIVSDYAIVVLETAQIRFTTDGSTAPTITVGAPMEVGQVWAFESFDELKKFRAIQTGGNSGSIKVLYYKRYVQ